MRKMFKAAASLAVGCAMLSTSAFAALTGTPALSDDRSAVNVTVSGVGASKESTILVLKGALTEMPATINEDEIVYINQKTAAADGTATYSMPLGTRVGDAKAVTVFAGATDEATAARLGSVTLASEPDRDFITDTVAGKATVTSVKISKTKAAWWNGYEANSIKAKIVLDPAMYTESMDTYMINVVKEDGTPADKADVFYSKEGKFFIAMVSAADVTAGYKFEVISKTTIPSDNVINTFGKVLTGNLLKAADATRVARVAANKYDQTTIKGNLKMAVIADVNNDATITAADAAQIAKKAAKKGELKILE